MIKSRGMRWTRNVARMGEKRNAYRILMENQKEGQDVGGCILLKQILER
jgi:hypothetical protein